MPRRGGRRKKTRTHDVNLDATSSSGAAAAAALPSSQAASSSATTDHKVPRSLVLRRGTTAPEVQDLVHDVRVMMQPYTALHFQEDAKNRKLTLAQYATHLALPMGISHILQFSQNHERLHLRMARMPQGPTLSFRVHQFSLAAHVKRVQKRPVAWTAGLSAHPPIVVTNNFDNSDATLPHVKLMRITFQNLFPAINVSTVKLSECRRVVLFDLVEEEQRDRDNTTRTLVHVRHYAIKATPTHVHRRVRRLVQTRSKLPNLSKINDIADYLGNGYLSEGGVASDSELDDDAAVVQLSDQYVGRGNNAASQQSSLKLVEMGPRLSLELTKVEKGLGMGDVMYHAYVHKTPAEAAALHSKAAAVTAQQQERRTTQEENVARKRMAVDEKKRAKKHRQDEKDQAELERLRQAPLALDDSVVVPGETAHTDVASSSSSSSSSEESSVMMEKSESDSDGE